LTRLRDLRVDELKLDRDLLRANPRESDLAITRAAIALGRDLHLNIVAAGIEDADRLELFTSMGAHAAQGFHICPPLLPHELARWVSESSNLEGSLKIPELGL
jgi:EAL domain-containing protein (putative c-di-GMP-specific phosphodiesterase class I)